jgi:hypothetical protein
MLCIDAMVYLVIQYSQRKCTRADMGTTSHGPSSSRMPDVAPRRSGEDLLGSPVNAPSSTLMVEAAKGYDFPELEGKEPQQQVRADVQ